MQKFSSENCPQSAPLLCAKSSKTIIGSISLCKFLVTGHFFRRKANMFMQYFPSIYFSSHHLSPKSKLCLKPSSPFIYQACAPLQVYCASFPPPLSLRHVPLFLHLYLLPLPILLLICPSSPRPTPIHRFVISSSSSFPKVLSFLGHCQWNHLPNPNNSRSVSHCQWTTV